MHARCTNKCSGSERLAARTHPPPASPPAACASQPPRSPPAASRTSFAAGQRDGARVQGRGCEGEQGPGEHRRRPGGPCCTCGPMLLRCRCIAASGTRWAHLGGDAVQVGAHPAEGQAQEDDELRRRESTRAAARFAACGLSQSGNPRVQQRSCWQQQWPQPVALRGSQVQARGLARRQRRHPRASWLGATATASHLRPVAGHACIHAGGLQPVVEAEAGADEAAADQQHILAVVPKLSGALHREGQQFDETAGF